MKNRRIYTNNKIWFSRWARASWAVFRSLNIVVHIQHMSINSFKDTLLKHASINTKGAISLFKENQILSLQSEWITSFKDNILEQNHLKKSVKANNKEIPLSQKSISNKPIIPIGVVKPYP